MEPACILMKRNITWNCLLMVNKPSYNPFICSINDCFLTDIEQLFQSVFKNLKQNIVSHHSLSIKNRQNPHSQIILPAERPHPCIPDLQCILGERAYSCFGNLSVGNHVHCCKFQSNETDQPGCLSLGAMKAVPCGLA